MRRERVKKGKSAGLRSREAGKSQSVLAMHRAAKMLTALLLYCVNFNVLFIMSTYSCRTALVALSITCRSGLISTRPVCLDWNVLNDKRAGEIFIMIELIAGLIFGFIFWSRWQGQKLFWGVCLFSTKKLSQQSFHSFYLYAVFPANAIGVPLAFPHKKT